MRELMIDLLTTLDGYASGDGWPGWWGLEGPEYLAWLGEQPPVTYLMGANTYRVMFGFASGEMPAGTAAMEAEEEASVDELTRTPKVVFSASLEEPLTWANTTLVRGDAVQAVRAMKEVVNALRSGRVWPANMEHCPQSGIPGHAFPGETAPYLAYPITIL